MRKNWLILFLFFLTFSVAGFLLIFNSISSPAQAGVSITARVTAICENGIVEEGEQCDGSDLAGQTCLSLGFSDGTLSCYTNCTFNTSGCIPAAPPPSGGGGGGYIPPVVTEVILQGVAYPGASVTVLKDGKITTTIQADSQANFEVRITDITAGIYTFGLWAKDKDGIRSITYTLTFRVSLNTITRVSGIFLPPTIDFDKISLQRGEILNIFGQTVPKIDVDIHIKSEEIIRKTTSDEIGAWLYSFNTQLLEEGAHTSKARFQLSPEERSSFGKILTFYIGKSAKEICPQADFNKDGRVNLIDFSMLLYWWGKYNVCVDQNQNGVVDLADFSMLMYWWTG